MKITIFGFMRFITLIALLIFAGYFLIVQKELLFGLLFIGITVLYYIVLTRESYFPSRDKTTDFAAKIAVAWTMLLLLMNSFLIGGPYSHIWIFVVPIPLGLLFLWMGITGR
ncbi:MAG: hypothetical protein PVF58_18795 [Candidatus Methanofastidiosia archaeon]|jgi:hypothetical protein